MNEREHFDLMVGDFAKAVGKVFERDEDGVWTIPAGNGVPVNAVYNEETRQVITFARIGGVLRGPFQEIWARVFLEANAFWDRSRGFTFALDHETGSLVIHDRRPYAYFRSPEHFAGYVNILIGLVGETIDRLEELEDAVEDAVVDTL